MKCDDPDCTGSHQSPVATMCPREAQRRRDYVHMRRLDPAYREYHRDYSYRWEGTAAGMLSRSRYRIKRIKEGQ